MLIAHCPKSPLGFLSVNRTRGMNSLSHKMSSKRVSENSGVWLVIVTIAHESFPNDRGSLRQLGSAVGSL